MSLKNKKVIYDEVAEKFGRLKELYLYELDELKVKLIKEAKEVRMSLGYVDSDAAEDMMKGMKVLLQMLAAVQLEISERKTASKKVNYDEYLKGIDDGL